MNARLAIQIVLTLLAPGLARGTQTIVTRQSVLETRWAADVKPANALPEYPRPQLVRPDWLNLNGLWDYAIAPAERVDAPAFKGKILVPFPVESALSGVKTNLSEHGKLWYRRTFVVPAAWRGRRVRLHFGAVDWRCQVMVNHQTMGAHEGGYDPFTFDITPALNWKGGEQITVCVTDPTEGDQPRGKQSRRPDGIFYTATSGIWQTVWLEPVPEDCIDRLKMTPDIDARGLHAQVSVNTFTDTLKVRLEALSQGKVVASVDGPANASLFLSLPAPHLWTPDDPFLYDLRVSLVKDGKIIDTVGSYFGMRKIALRKDDQGFIRMALNDQFTFEIGALDQGFWPDGIYTAPTDEALRWDIEFLKKGGFNLIRKHVKVEPDRWYYWCDKLGMLVWQDMPSGNNSTSEGQRDFQNELRRMVDNLQNHPSIIVWVLFNEGWGQYDTEELADWLKRLDPSRLVDNASGWTDMHAGDLVDMHSYPGPETPAPESRRASVLGEFGGYGYAVPDHSWSNHCWGYVMLTNRAKLEEKYRETFKHVWRMHALRGLSAVVYTQNTDVETECNGLQTYDRAVAKIDPAALLAATRVGFTGKPVRIVLPDGLSGRADWKYTVEKPSAGWFKPSFETSGWKEGIGGFGTPGTPGITMNSRWDTSDIWMRREFALQPDELSGIKLQVFHDEDVEIYLNGVLALKQPGFMTDYDEFDISDEAARRLKAGINTIAVHCHQTEGGQGIDVGILAPDLAKTAGAGAK
jgi:hypothetical protein